MGKPDFEEGYEAFQVDDVVIYVARHLLNEHVKHNILLINLEGYGRFQFRLPDEDMNNKE
jgi:hypothetical protein